MKKIVCIALALVMVLALAACGSSKSEPVTYGFLDETLGVESYAIGFRTEDQELADTVTAAVKALVKNGTYAAIGEKYPDIKDYLSLKAEDIRER